MNALALLGLGMFLGAIVWVTGAALGKCLWRLGSLLVDALQPSYPQVLDTSKGQLGSSVSVVPLKPLKFPQTFRVVVRFQDRRS